MLQVTFLSKQHHQLQPHFHSKARQLSTQLQNSSLVTNYPWHIFLIKNMFVIKKVAIPAYSVSSLHFEHSVAPAAENVLAEHMVQLKEKVQVWDGLLHCNANSFPPSEPNLFYEKLFLLAKTCQPFTDLKHTVFWCSLIKFCSMLNWKAVQKKAACLVNKFVPI